MSFSLLPHQQECSSILFEAFKRRRFLLDATKTGRGKTYTALAVAKKLSIPFAVICPANIVSEWKRTATEVFGLKPEFVLSYDKARMGKKHCPFVDKMMKKYVNRMTKKPAIETTYLWRIGRPWTGPMLLIFDEVHNCFNAKTQNGKMLLAAFNNPNPLVLGLSATAATNPLQMETIGFGLGLFSQRDYWLWCLRQGCKEGHFGGLVFDTGQPHSPRQPTPSQAFARRRLAEIHETIFHPLDPRGVRADIAFSGEAPNLISACSVDIDWKHKAIQVGLKEIEQEGQKDVERALEKDAFELSPLTINLRAQQRTELGKVPILVEWLEQILKEGGSVILFLNFVRSLRVARELIKNPLVAEIVGGQSEKARCLNLTAFQTNERRVCLVQSAAGCASISLDDRTGDAPRTSLIAPNYSARVMLQTLGRPHRGPTTRSVVTQKIVFAARTIEERACEMVREKLSNLSMLNDGDFLGVPY